MIGQAEVLARAPGLLTYMGIPSASQVYIRPILN